MRTSCQKDFDRLAFLDGTPEALVDMQRDATGHPSPPILRYLLRPLLAAVWAPVSGVGWMALWREGPIPAG